jgi:hypothetical protein
MSLAPRASPLSSGLARNRLLLQRSILLWRSLRVWARTVFLFRWRAWSSSPPSSPGPQALESGAAQKCAAFYPSLHSGNGYDRSRTAVGACGSGVKHHIRPSMEAPMRTLFLVAAVLTSVTFLPLVSTAAQPADRYYDSARYYGKGAYRHERRWREREVCEERAEAEDRTGEFRAYPCWAREAFGRSRRGVQGR